MVSVTCFESSHPPIKVRSRNAKQNPSEMPSEDFTDADWSSKDGL